MRAALRERARSRDTQRRDDETDNHYFQDARHFHEPSSFCFRLGLWRPDLNRKRFTDAFSRILLSVSVVRRAVVGYAGLWNVSQFPAKTIAQKFATFWTLVNLMII